MLSQQPKEMKKYVIANDYQVFDRMMEHLDNKSIVELFVKILTELSENSGPLPGISDVQTVLQQSGQSGDDVSKPEVFSVKETQKRIQSLIVRILDEKLSDSTDLCTKLGAMEVL